MEELIINNRNHNENNFGASTSKLLSHSATFSNKLNVYKRFSGHPSEMDYEMDDMDHRWLEIINKERAKLKLRTIPIEHFEFLMDCFEKQSYFFVKLNNEDNSHEVICSICREKQDEVSDTILKCCMCHLNVHRSCYGIMYTPNGRWFCRRCLYSPSTPVRCIFCPIQDGAFIQTDNDKWGHILCAMYIPEVYFETTIILEKIKNVTRIPQFRYQLKCYICNYAGKYRGICLQCKKAKCLKAYHVTCAQEANLCMKYTKNQDGQLISITYCHIHSTTDKEVQVQIEKKMNAVRHILRKKREIIPVIATPKITLDRLKPIISQIYGNYDGIISRNIHQHSDFVMKLYAYWSLKRKSRNGVPMLYQLQSAYRIRVVTNKFEITSSHRILHWKRVEANLEKLKKLCDLIQTIEKYKYIMLKNYFEMIKSVAEKRSTHWKNQFSKIVHIRDCLYRILEPKNVYIELTLPDYSVECDRYPDLHDREQNQDVINGITNCISTDHCSKFFNFESDNQESLKDANSKAQIEKIISP